MPPVTGQRFPLQSIGNYVWDSGLSNWVKMVGSGGVLDVNIAKWGNTVVTGDDVTLRFYALNNFAVAGLARSIGDIVAPVVASTTGKTLLRHLEEILAALLPAGALQWQVQTASGSFGAAPNAVALDTGITGGRMVHEIIISGPTSCTVLIEGSIDGLTYYTLFTLNLPAPGGGTVTQTRMNGFRYLRASLTAHGGGGNVNIIMSTSR